MASNIGVQNVQRMRFLEEAHASFAVDQTSSMGSFVDIPFVEGSLDFGPDTPTESPGHARQKRDFHPEEILMVTNCPLSFQYNLSVPDTIAGDGTSASECNAMKVLGTVWGGTYVGQGDTISDASPSSSAFDVTTAARWGGGKAVGLTDTNGVLHLREIESISGSTLTLKMALPFTPSNGATLYACCGYYLNNHDADDVKSGQFVLDGLGTSDGGYEDCWVLLGAQQTEGMSIELPIGGLPRITHNMTAADFCNGDDVNITAAAIGLASYSNTNEVLVADGYLHVVTVGSSTAVEVHAQLSLDLGNIKYLPVPSPGGTNTIAHYILCGDHPKVSGTLELPYEDQTWTDAKANKTHKAIFLQCGSSTAGGALLISVPNVQVTEVQRMDYNGLQGQRVSFVASTDTDTNVTTTAIGMSPIRIHSF